MKFLKSASSPLWARGFVATSSFERFWPLTPSTARSYSFAMADVPILSMGGLLSYARFEAPAFEVGSSSSHGKKLQEHSAAAAIS